MRFRALNDYTNKLPLLNKIYSPSIIGKSTNEAIESGVLLGVINEVDGYIDTIKQQFKGLKTIITGGDAIFFDKNLKNTIFVDQNLVLTGLNRILNYNGKGN